MSADMLSTYFTEEEQLISGIPLLTNQKRKEEMVRAIEYLITRLHFTILTKLGPLILFLFDNCDSDEMALNTLSIAISVVHDLNSTGSDQTIINVFGDEVTEDSVIADLYKLFFVILTPFFIPVRDEFNSKIFDKFESSGGSGITYASNMTAKILLYFKPENVDNAKKFFIGRYGNTTTFNLKELNNDIKYNIVKTKLLDDNITMDMVKTLPQFIEHFKKSQRAKTEITFSYDYNTFANTGKLTDKSLANCTVCTRKDEYMTQFRIVARNIFYMFAAMDEYVETDGTFNTPLDDHKFQQLRINPNACKCKSLDHLMNVNEKVGKYIEDLHILPFTFPESQQNTKALAYIMNYVVIPNNQLRQSPERRVIKITREMWKDFLTKKGSYAPVDARVDAPVDARVDAPVDEYNASGESLYARLSPPFSPSMVVASPLPVNYFDRTSLYNADDSSSYWGDTGPIAAGEYTQVNGGLDGYLYLRTNEED